VGLPWLVILGFLRLSTHPRVFTKPLSADQALERVALWISQQNVQVVQESAHHWTILRELLAAAGTAGNLTSDAHLAALAIGNGATLASFDTDFDRFQGLRWQNLLPTES
jgi:uncharacterized protein